jgi:hypothetical protein
MVPPLGPDLLPREIHTIPVLPLPKPPGLLDPSSGLDFSNIFQDTLLRLSRRMLLDGHSEIGRLIDQYILQTRNFTGPGAITENSTLHGFYGITAGIAIALLGLVLTYTCLRSVLERSMRPRYTLKVMLPKVMLVMALVPVGLPLIQAAVDLNNAVVTEVWGGYTPGAQACADTAIWCAVMGDPITGNLLLSLLLLLIEILLVVLALVGVARTVLIVVLGITAPLAFLGLLLPETRSYTNAWRRLFVTTVFSQALQVLVLRVAITLTLKGGFLQTMHGLVVMYLVLKAPSALHAASSAESKLISTAKHLEHHVQSAVQHAISPTHSRVRSHPAASQ